MRWSSTGSCSIDDYYVYHSSSSAHNLNGVAIIVSKEVNGAVLNVIPHSDRIIMLQMKVASTKLNIIQVYAPTSDCEETVIEDFYSQLDQIMKYIKSNEITVVMGDLNAKVGKGRDGDVVGQFGLGVRNERGDRFVEFCTENSMIVMNTFFKLPERRLYTWKSPADKLNNIIRNQIDYITINKRFRNAITSVKTFPGADVPSDHNLLLAILNIRFKKIKRGIRLNRYDMSLLSNEEIQSVVKKEINEKLDGHHRNDLQDIEQMWKDTKNIFNEISETKLRKQRNDHKQKWMTDDILVLMDERRKFKNKSHTEYKKLHAEIRKRIKHAKERWFKEQCEEIESYEKAHNSFHLYKKVKELSGFSGMNYDCSLEDVNGNLLSDIEDKLARWKQYIQELFDDDRSGMTETKVESGPSIMEEEVMRAIKRLKNKKATGPDNIHGELLKLVEGNGLRTITKLFNLIYETGKIPDDWLYSTFIALPKKANAKKCGEYRTISLMSQFLKAFLYIIHERVYRKIESQIGDAQFGFRCGLGTRDALFGLQVLMQRCRDYNQEVYACFIDFEKAFDRIQHDRMISILKASEIDDKDTRIIQNLYWGQKASIRVGNAITGDVEIKRGVRQGCVLSPLLFNMYSEGIFSEALWEASEGIVINGEVINNLRYADDTVCLASTLEDLQLLLDRIKATCEEFGLQINCKKTKYMIMSRQEIIDAGLMVGNVRLQRVEKFKYLGCLGDSKIDHTIEIKCRIEQARAAFVKMRNIFCSKNLDLQLRVRLVKCFVFSVLLYGVEAWTVSESSMKRLEAFELWIYRRMLRISWVDRVTNNEVLKRMEKDKEVSGTIKSRKLQYFAHVMRNASKYRLLHVIIEGKIQGRRPPGRRKISWLKDLRKWYNETSVGLFRAAVDKVKIANMIANAR